MKRSELEHLIRAAGSIANDSDTQALVKHRMVQHKTLLSRERATDVPVQVRELVRARIERDFREAEKTADR